MTDPRRQGSELSYCLKVHDDSEAPVRNFYLEAGSTYVIGSASEVEIRFPVAGVSRRHAKIEVMEGRGAVIEDLSSRNGTWLGDRRVHRAALVGGEQLSFGSVTTEWVALDPALAGIAIAGNGKALGPREADLANPSTLGISIEERLLRSLGPWVSRSAEGVVAAQSLIAVWLADLPIDRVEVLHRDALGEEVVTAAGGCEVRRAADSEVAVDGWRFRFWGSIAPRLVRLQPIFELVVRILSDDVDRVESDPAPSPMAPLPEPASLSPEMQRLYRRAAKVARGDVPILIRGESGSGKEVLATFVHRSSRRCDGPFLTLNCAALPKDLLEAELFGIERGVATGVAARSGLLERSSGGSLFLDEIGDMAPATQAKVLRALEERRVYRVGGRVGIEVDVRFLAATHRDLERGIEEGSFRADLYHRLAAFEVRIPPLRERPEDVALLAGHFFARELERDGVSSPGLSRGALGALCEYAWPGNVRELRLEIAQAMLLLDPGEPLGLEHLSERVRSALGLAGPEPLTLEAQLRRAERQAFAGALAVAEGDRVRAMGQLGVSRATFYRKLKELGLESRG